VRRSAQDAEIAQLRRNLRRGQILTALVKGQGSGSRWYLSLGGVTLPFDSRDRFVIGERILLLVQRLQPRIVLKRVGHLRDGSVDSCL